MVCGCGRWQHNADGQRALVQMLPAARHARSRVVLAAGRGESGAEHWRETSLAAGHVDEEGGEEAKRRAQWIHRRAVAALRRTAARGRPALGERKASAAAWVGGESTGARAWLQAAGTPGQAAVHDEQLATPYGRGCRHLGEERSVGGEKDRDRGVGRRSGRLSFMPNELLR
ncbi:hypothetical protein CFC21_051560 [Triticum aestivum]|uniref:Uncharacterized protein n=2 Tax=Triticum aestivum TaxID=4565 RepID=A0A3B6HR72_WHEAT|nr:hypothetical protein CFC21_051560 [Triticum aestivum]